MSRYKPLNLKKGETMGIMGRKLKGLIDAGIKEHSDDLTLNVHRVLQDFADSIDRDKSYDLFCCLVRIILKSDEDVAPIITDLMKTANTELEVLGENTFSDIGNYFDDFIKKPKLLERFKELSEAERTID